MRTTPLVASLLVGANATLTPDQIAQVTEGFIGSALHYEKLDGYKACYLDDNVKPIEDIEAGLASLEAAIKAKDVSGVAKAAAQLKAGFNEILIDQKDCVAKTGDPAHLAAIEKYMSKYDDSEAHMQSHIEADMAWNSIDIARKLADAKTKYDAGKFSDFGSDYGVIVDEVVIGTTRISAVEDVNPTLKEVGQIIEGILVGALKAEGLDNLQDCIKDGETIYTDVEEGIVLLKKGDASDELKGLKKIAAGVIEIKSAVSDCEGIVADFGTLAKMAAVFSNPASFAYHIGKDLLVNGVSIYHEIEDSVTQYDAAKYEPMGEDIGEALAKLLIGGALDVQEEWRVTQANNYHDLNLF